MIRLWLPFPPATNNLFLNVGKRRVRTKRYDAWIKAADDEVRGQLGFISGPYTAHISAERPDRRRRDIDGIIKPLLDLLVKVGVTEDDSLCQRVTAEWAGVEPVKGAQVIITLEGANA